MFRHKLPYMTTSATQQNMPLLHFSKLISNTVIALTIGAFFITGIARAAEKLHPNFIIILADDMGFGDIEPFGSQRSHTPNLNRMAKEGMKLTSFYAAPVCTPSRAQIITGCYAKRVSLPNVLMPVSNIGINAREHTIAELLHNQGYATMIVGKWHLGDQRKFLPTHRGFDHYLGLPYSNDMGPQEAAAKRKLNHASRPPLPLVRDDQVIETVTPRGQELITARYTDEALNFVKEHKDSPFFLYFAHTAVHFPIHPGDKFRGKSDSLYTDWVDEVDWSVGRVLDTVRELGLADNTLVFFTSDNGPWLAKGTNAGTAGPLRGGKMTTYEGGVREPTIAWWPGKIQPGSVCDAVAANFDFLPTFVKLAGGAVPSDNKIDGEDISPLLFRQSKESPHKAFFYFNGNRLQAVRSGPWKLAIQARPNEIGPKEKFTPKLYNLDEEIGEKTDVAAQHPDVVKRLQELVKQMDSDLGVEKKGPGVRQPGREQNPVGLWLPGTEPKDLGSL